MLSIILKRSHAWTSFLGQTADICVFKVELFIFRCKKHEMHLFLLSSIYWTLYNMSHLEPLILKLQAYAGMRLWRKMDNFPQCHGSISVCNILLLGCWETPLCPWQKIPIRGVEKWLNLLVQLCMWLILKKKDKKENTTQVFDVDRSSAFTRLIPKMHLHQCSLIVIKLSYYFLHFLFLPILYIEDSREKDINNQRQIHPRKIINSSARLDANPHPVWVKHLVWWANC